MTTQKEKKPTGRPVGSFGSSKRARQTRLKELLRMLEPTTVIAFERAKEMVELPVGNDKITGTVQLQAIKVVIETHLKLLDEACDTSGYDNNTDGETRTGNVVNIAENVRHGGVGLSTVYE